MTPRFETIRDKFPGIKYAACPVVGRDRALPVCEQMASQCWRICEEYKRAKEGKADE